jgi:hypothetical protein
MFMPSLILVESSYIIGPAIWQLHTAARELVDGRS